jgi:hypothetical protein
MLLQQNRVHSMRWPGCRPAGLDGADQEAALFADLLLCERLHDFVSRIQVIIKLKKCYKTGLNELE